MAPLAQRAPSGLGLALQSATLFHSPAQELILDGTPEQTGALLQALRGIFLPNLLVARAGTGELDPELSQGKEPGKAYLCSGSSCQPPVSQAESLAAGLRALSSSAR